MNENVIPIKKSERFPVFKGRVDLDGQVVEEEIVGFGFVKPGAKMFRLKLWMFPKEQFFIAGDDDPSKYVILALDEYQLPSNELRTHWNRIGKGELAGCHIKFKFHLLPYDLFLSLFPSRAESKALDAAA